MLIGHKQTIKDLKKLADSGRLSHGYLFYGPAMVGKRAVALSFANYLENGEFAPPKLLQDCFFAAPEGGTLGIDKVRELKNFLWQKPNVSKRRAAIVDQAETMTQEAQNAILRIAEEPPASTVLMLITSDPESILPTLLSRLHKMYFSPVGEEEIEKWLESDLKIKKSEAAKLAKSSLGKPGLAHALLHNERLGDYLKSAEKLLKLPEGKRRDFIKEIIAPEDFSFSEFLDAVALVLTGDAASESPRLRQGSGGQARLWHKLLALRQRTANFPLNPRLQLENLLS